MAYSVITLYETMKDSECTGYSLLFLYSSSELTENQTTQVRGPTFTAGRFPVIYGKRILRSCLIACGKKSLITL
jgi:hypothetical protein